MTSHLKSATVQFVWKQFREYFQIQAIHLIISNLNHVLRDCYQLVIWWTLISSPAEWDDVENIKCTSWSGISGRQKQSLINRGSSLRTFNGLNWSINLSLISGRFTLPHPLTHPLCSASTYKYNPQSVSRKYFERIIIIQYSIAPPPWPPKSPN